MPLGIFALPNLAEFGVEITLSLSYAPPARRYFLKTLLAPTGPADLETGPSTNNFYPATDRLLRSQPNWLNDELHSLI
jgi:hypothetical protein